VSLFLTKPLKCYLEEDPNPMDALALMAEEEEDQNYTPLEASTLGVP
jgi:hypothetical protein